MYNTLVASLALLLINPTQGLNLDSNVSLAGTYGKTVGDHYPSVSARKFKTTDDDIAADGGDDKSKKVKADPLPIRPLTKDWDLGKSLNRTLETTLDEGTWVNLDISPDGKEIVFDLLGDIYTLPIEGGQAKLLKGGPSFDIQPTYSPDGKQILFTSDASGFDNLWISDKSGKSFQVTDEGYRTVSNARWAPSGKEVVGVKWYTSGRSIPAGTIQRYKLNGQEIVKPELLVDKKTVQVGVEEPIYSPHGAGDSIYYSTNDADKTTWNYDKDPHAGIFNVYRFNTTSQDDSVKVAGGVGSAIRPTPSRDGKKLAFVRKVEFTWSLIVKDLETGDETNIWDGLSRDNQESSASNGAYPRFSWLPDNSAIIIWAQGKIHRVPLDKSPVKVIPFKANVKLNIAPTVKHQQSLIEASEEKTFNNKAIQFFDISKDGTKAVYIVTGQTYVKDLKSGKSTLLKLSDSEDNRHAVSFHPNDSNIIIQSRWSDSKLSLIEVVDLKKEKIVSTFKLPRGHYNYPSISNDGKKVAFTKSSGDEIAGTVLAQAKLGVWVAELNEKFELVKDSAELVIPGETAGAKFTKDDKQLRIVGYTDPYVFDLESGEATTLGNIKDNASDVTLSNDAKWVTYPQYRQVYVAPATANTTYWSKPGSAPEGLIRLSKDGGQTTVIGGPDGQTAYYLQANNLFEAHIPTVVEKCGAVAKSDTARFGADCVQPLLKSYDLSVKVPISRPPSDKVLVLNNAKIITMKTGNPASDIIENGRLVIKGNKILAVGESSSVEIPKGAEVKDLAGATVLPGFLDEHAHWSGFDYPVRSHWQHQLALSYGVTTMHNPSYDTVQGFVEQELTRSGRLLAPRIFTTGTIIYGAEGAERVEILNIEEARSILRLLKSYGAFSVKSYNQPSRYARQMILEAARELGLLVVPEGGMHFAWNTNQIIDGHTTIEHSLSPGTLYEDLQILFEKSGTAWTPTLVVSYGGLEGERFWYQSTNVWEDPKMRARHPLKDLEASTFRRTLSDEKEYVFNDIGKSLTNLTRRGVLINPGAHGQRQGVGYLWELWMLSKGGMNNYEVLRSATRNPALTLGFKDVGSLEAGKLADYIVYPADASPLKDLKYLRNITHVSVNGFLHEANSLDQVWPEKKKALPLPQLNDSVLVHDGY
ncbi:tricorn protease N-terminal domain-containing protein [Conidiobolus coronatus NRRL 28638]|uniref:Tricorn protease N-terminal domain-containing protein n=1 Tax=Conidiobolus coronatus (strain ATCC 28846 / CBS 209.66 / NRRL 28638) TaxID=796925 RepID=A0A137PF67_CONC2|nr:tricorn protease N-terminal domain-containing protein [Conidiobolus coronatus NRRL 28638]|eukprot:KXN73654.1 tricorn protease N-terminal domain-containing protein [Conidiobolus coronatus NRRL 28638]